MLRPETWASFLTQPFFSILPRVMPLEEAMEKETARSNMEQTAEQLFRLIRCLQA